MNPKTSTSIAAVFILVASFVIASVIACAALPAPQTNPAASPVPPSSTPASIIPVASSVSPSSIPVTSLARMASPTQPSLSTSVPTTPSALVTSPKDSPFGFIMGTSTLDKRNKNLNGVVDLNSKWIRLSGTAGIIWELVEKTKGKYDWGNTDSIISEFAQKGIKILVTVGASNKNYQSERGYLPSDINAYDSFLTKATERYDGDGIDDAPGSPVVAAWQIGNEVDSKMEWSDTPENYAKLMKESYRAIKSANSNAKVVMAGMGGPNGISKYSQILNYMNDSVYFDVIDFHWHAVFGGNYKKHKTRDPNRSESFDDYLNEIKNILNNKNYGNAKIWITEMSASDINPEGQTEKSQAVDLIKRYVYPGSKGVSVIFWGTLYEQNGLADRAEIQIILILKD